MPLHIPPGGGCRGSIAAYLYMEKENADSAAMSRDSLVRLPSAIGPRFCGLYRISRIFTAVLGSPRHIFGSERFHGGYSGPITKA